MTCYHTCKNRGDRESILGLVPFHSNNNKAQWLGAGYYLWTDSDLFAHAWGRNPKYSSTDYAIVKFTLCVPQEQYLDLVGKVDHQQYFLTLVEEYKTRLQQAIQKSTDVDSRRRYRHKLDCVSVSSVINHFRKLRTFSFKVVKAADVESTDTKELDFLEKSSLGEKLLLPTRQQIVVFPEAKNLLSMPEWHHP